MNNMSVNGCATALAGKKTVIKGSGVLHRKASKSQLAALVAAIVKQDVGYEPSAKQLASWFGVNLAYVGVAMSLTPAARAAIISGEKKTEFAALLNPPKTLALPKSKPVPTEMLVQLIREIGIEKTLDLAASVEAAQ
jgi:hypothetical protein